MTENTCLFRLQILWKFQMTGLDNGLCEVEHIVKAHFWKIHQPESQYKN